MSVETGIPTAGAQFIIAAAGYEAVVCEVGATLRTLDHEGRPLVDGFGPSEASPGARGQILAPWPNRLRDGRYVFDGVAHRLPVDEPERGNAVHGLVRAERWTRLGIELDSVTLAHCLVARPGYPWTLDLTVTYAVGPEGLTVTQAATNRSARPAPYASGAHPYLTVGPGPVDGWELTLPAASRSVTDERLVPVGVESVGGGDHDFRAPRLLGSTVLNDGFTALVRGPDGLARTVVRDPATDVGVALWVDVNHRWLQVYSADDAPVGARRSLAVEPMTAGANALATGADLVVLAPAGEDGDRFAASWGIEVA